MIFSHCKSLPVAALEHVHVWHFPLSDTGPGKAFLFSACNTLWVHTRLAHHPHARGSQQSYLTPLWFHFLGVLAASCLLMLWRLSGHFLGSQKGLEMLSGLLLPDPTDSLKPSGERPQHRRGHQSRPCSSLHPASISILTS